MILYEINEDVKDLIDVLDELQTATDALYVVAERRLRALEDGAHLILLFSRHKDEIQDIPVLAVKKAEKVLVAAYLLYREILGYSFFTFSVFHVFDASAYACLAHSQNSLNFRDKMNPPKDWK